MALKTFPFTFRPSKLAEFWGRKAINPFDYFQQWHEQPALHFGLPFPPWLLFQVNALGLLRLTVYLPCFMKLEVGYLFTWLRSGDLNTQDCWRAEAYFGMKLDAAETGERLRAVERGELSPSKGYDWLVSVSARFRTRRDSIPSPLGMA